MPRYTIRDPQTGRTVTIDGPSPPTEQELEQIFATVNAQGGQARVPPMAARGYTDPNSVKITPPEDQVIANAKLLAGGAVDLGKGVAKELAAQGVRGGALLRQIPGVEALANALPSVTVNTTPSNATQMVGGRALDAAEYVQGGRLAAAMPGVATQAVTGGAVNAGLAQTQGAGPTGIGVAGALGAAVPLASAAVDAIPRTSRAAQNFQDVMAAAKDLPVDVNAPGDVALRIQDLAQRGGTMPKAVRDFLRRTTDPNQGPLTYEEARDFASNISRLSANEYQRLTPVMAREVANLRVSLNDAIAQTAKQAGKLDQYRAAMTEYARAAQFRDAVDGLVRGAKKAAVPSLAAGGAAGAGYWLTSRMLRLLGGGGD